MNGTDRCSGRVEIRHNDQWGTVCDDQWDIRDAQVLCRAMDCGSALTAKSNAYFGEGQGDIWLDDVECLGNETSLLHCKHANLGESNCGHGEDAGVECSGIRSSNNSQMKCKRNVKIQMNPSIFLPSQHQTHERDRPVLREGGVLLRQPLGTSIQP